METGRFKADSPLSNFVSSFVWSIQYEEIGEGKWGGAV